MPTLNEDYVANDDAFFLTISDGLARDVRLVWGLELMVEVVDLGALSVTQARNVGRKMHQVNPKSITKQVLTDFLARIRR